MTWRKSSTACPVTLVCFAELTAGNRIPRLGAKLTASLINVIMRAASVGVAQEADRVVAEAAGGGHAIGCDR
jgi:hypothetical protein